MRTFGRVMLAGMAFSMMAAGLWSCGSQRALSMVRASGNEAYYEGRYEDAEREYQEVVDRRPQDARARYDLARTQMVLVRPTPARENMIVATHLDPYNDAYLDLLSEALLEAGSEADLRVFLERQSNDMVRRWQNEVRRGRYLARLGDADEAERALKRAATLNAGQDAEPQIALAELYGTIGNQEEQVRRLRMALGADPHSSKARAALRELDIVPGPTLALTPEEAISAPFGDQALPNRVVSENPDALPE